jgi:hypothetical protein
MSIKTPQKVTEDLENPSNLGHIGEGATPAVPANETSQKPFTSTYMQGSGDKVNVMPLAIPKTPTPSIPPKKKK